MEGHNDTFPELMSLRQAAEMSGRDWRTLKSWARSGDVPGLAVEINGRMLVRKSVLRELLSGPVEA